VTYLAATAFVVWLGTQGHLRPWAAPFAAVVAIDAAVIGLATLGAWAWIHLPRRGSSASSSEPVLSGDLTSDVSRPHKPKRLRLAPNGIARRSGTLTAASR